MNTHKKVKPLTAAALGTAFAVNLATVPAAPAAGNPFGYNDLGEYPVAEKTHECKCGEGKCGKCKSEGKCGDGKCGVKKGT